MITATKLPDLPFSALLATKVYSFPFDKESSSIHKCGPIFQGKSNIDKRALLGPKFQSRLLFSCNGDLVYRFLPRNRY
jgi:hypothetical protein